MNRELLFEYMSNLTAFSLPVPDIFVILAAVILLLLLKIASTQQQRKAVENAADAYIKELTRASRQTHIAEQKLAKVKSELERERRLSRRASQRRK